MTEKEKALTKLRLEINKDIDLAIFMAKSCGILELRYFLYYVRIIRLTTLSTLTEEKTEKINSLYLNTVEDSMKYIISIIAKYGKQNDVVPSKKKFPELKLSLVQELLKHINYINSKYEIESTIQLCKIEVSGERNQNLKVDLSSLDSDPQIKILLNYFLRIDFDNDLRKHTQFNGNELFEIFKDEYLPLSDLFEKELGISVDEFCWLFNELIKQFLDKMRLVDSKFEKLANGDIDIQSKKTYNFLSNCFIHNEQEILNHFDPKFSPILKRLMFIPENFDERQLRFHKVTRQPLIKFGKNFIISPELILDSLFLNTHYSLLESQETKQEYISKKSTQFLDLIVATANKFGYTETEREKDLYEGKKQIGDIDIILKNDIGEYIFVEAKNHALPMDVFFKNSEETKKHLEYLQKEWEKKVLKRVDHLKTEYKTYSLPKEHTYIVVSKYPEIISHYSDILILSLHEFEVWLKDFKSDRTFNEFHKNYYESKNDWLTEKDIIELQSANLILGRYDKS